MGSVQPAVAVVLIGHNEAALLPQALQSAQWADELIYVDCASEDASWQIATRFTSRVYRRPNLYNLQRNKQFAIDQAQARWIFYLDADETISAELATELRQIASRSDAECTSAAYKLARRNVYFGRWLKHGGFYPDHQLRFFRRGKASFPCRKLHERLQVDGKIGTLKHDLWHQAMENPLTALRKIDFHTTFDAMQQARLLLAEGKSLSRWKTLEQLWFQPGRRFLRSYLLKRGFRNGTAGLVLLCFMWISAWTRFVKCWYWTTHPDALPPQDEATAPAGSGAKSPLIAATAHEGTSAAEVPAADAPAASSQQAAENPHRAASTSSA